MIIRSLNLSAEKGTVKKPVNSVTINKTGLEGDAHAGEWHRQVSLLGEESYAGSGFSIQEPLPYGIFAENITTLGTPAPDTPDLKSCRPGDFFRCGRVLLEVTQIGKKCHGPGCAVMQQTGHCVMPVEGIFARALSEGTLSVGDPLVYEPKIYRIGVITLSNRAYNGTYEDRSGPLLARLISSFCEAEGWKHKTTNTLLPDDEMLLENEVLKFIHAGYDMIFTTGGTGMGPADITVQVLKPLIDKEIPGIMEFIRIKYGSENPNALISGSLAGLAGNTMIFALPGSVRAVEEYFTEIARCLKHLVYMRMGLDIH